MLVVFGVVVIMGGVLSDTILKTALNAAPYPTETNYTNIAYLKTHKTGSTTFGSILFRYSARRGLVPVRIHEHIFKSYATATPRPGKVFLNHITAGQMREGDFENALAFYRRAVRDMTFITAVREPMQRMISWFYYFVQPQHPKLTLRQWLYSTNAENCTLSAEFGVYTEEQLSVFMTNHIKRFDMILVSDRFLESICVMALRFGWGVADVLHRPLLDSHREKGRVRWDGKVVLPTPKVEDQPKEIRDRLRNLTVYDYAIYNYAMANLTASAKQYGTKYIRVRDNVLKLQVGFDRYCNTEKTPDCAWYEMTDLEYESVLQRGSVPMTPLDVEPWWGQTAKQQLLRRARTVLNNATDNKVLPLDVEKPPNIKLKHCEDRGIENTSCVECVGDINGDGWRRTCVYHNLYFSNGKFMFLVDDTTQLLDETEFSDTYTVFAKDRIVGGTRVKEPCDFVPEQTHTSISLSTPTVTIDSTAVLFHAYHVEAIGHVVWNDIFSIHTALEDVGLPDVTFAPITLSRSGGRNNLLEILRVFSGSDTILHVADWVRNNQTVLLKHVVVGTGQGGADDIQQFRRLVQGRAQTRFAFLRFRTRMFLAYNVTPPERSTYVKIVVVQNKRKDLPMETIVNELKTSKRRVHYLDFRIKTYNGASGFKNMLELLSDVNVYVSGVGTAMMWAPFVPPGAVVVNLGWITAYGGPPYHSTLHSMDHMMQTYFRVLYYPARQRWNGVSPEIVSNLVDQAEHLYNAGFYIPVSIADNADVSGAAYMIICLHDIEVCKKMLAAASGDPRAATCGAQRYIYMFLHMRGCWKPGGKFSWWSKIDWGVVKEVNQLLVDAGTEKK